MATPNQSIDPTLLALQTAKKALPASPSTQQKKKPVLQSNIQQSQAPFATSSVTPTKIGGISSPFGAANINSSPVLGGATPQEIGTTAKQLQSLPKAMPDTGAIQAPATVYGELFDDITLNGLSEEEMGSLYPEIPAEIRGSIYDDIKLNGMKEEELYSLYPELAQGGPKDNFITNLGSGIAGTASATGKLGKNLAFKAVDLYRTKVQGKEKLTPEQIAMAEQSPMGQNLSSITDRQTEAQKQSVGGKIGTTVGTLGQAFSTPTGVSSLYKIPAIANIAKKAPVIFSMIKGGLQGVIGQDQYTLMTEGRQSTAEERYTAGGIGLAFPFLGAIIKGAKPFLQKGIKSAVNTLQTSGIINPAKFDQIKSQLIAEGVEGIEKATVDDVANFLTERGIKGTRQQQASILEEVANKSRQAKKEVLDLSTNLHAPDSAKVLAQTLVDELGTAKSQATKAIANKAQQLLNKLDNGGATLNEIDDLRAMGWKELNTRTSAGNVKISQQDVDNLIGEVRGYIEDAAQAEGLPQLVGYQGGKNLIRMLNNQTSTAKGLAEGILRRDSTDAVQQLMTFMSARGGGVIAGGLAGSQGGMFDNNTTAGKIGNIAVGAFLGGVVDNPKIKSNVAQYLNKLTGTQKGAILKRMESGGKELLEREDKDVINGLKNIIMGSNKEIPNSLPFKPNANTTINGITTSTMGNSNKAGVILSEGGILPPKPTPKTPPITVEKGAIGMGTPKPNKTNVLPPKTTTAPSVSTPKVISEQIDDIISEYGKITYKGEIDKVKNLSPNVESKLLEIPGIKQYFASNGIKDRNGLVSFLEKRHKIIREPIKTTKKADMTQASKDRFVNGMNQALENAGIKARLPISKANIPIAPKKGMAKLPKGEVLEQNITNIDDDLIQEAKKYKTWQDMYNHMPYDIRNKLDDQGIYSRKHIEDFYNLAKSEKIMYRGQATKGKDISYNNTSYIGDTDGGVFFTPSKQDASKYGNNIIEIKSNIGNTVSIAESKKLQKMAEEKVKLALKNNTTVSDIIEQMALGRPKSFAKYTGKKFVETGDKFGEKGEMIYYKDI